MNAMEKVAWTELVVSIAAIAVVTLMVPWLGNVALSGFSLLALIAFGGLFLRSRGNQVVVDERDSEIEGRAKSIGIAASWAMLWGALILAIQWAAYNNVETVSIWFLNWLIWIQFALTYGIKGLVAVVLYRRRHAA